MPLRIAVVLAGVMAFGTLLLAIAHLGVTIPLLSRLGPQGGAVPPAVVAFAVATLLFGGVALGLYRRSRTAWIGTIVLSLAIIAMSLAQYRGVVSGIGIGLAAVLVILLVLPPSRHAALR